MTMKVLKRTGGQITNGPIIFTRDDQYILLAHGTGILVFDGHTAALMGRMEVEPELESSSKETIMGHQEPIVSLALHPTIVGQVFSVSADGTLCMWHYEAGTLLGTWNIPYRIANIVSAQDHPTLYLACMMEKGSKKKHGKGASVIKVDLSDINESKPFCHLFDTHLGTAAIAISADANRMIIKKKGGLILWDIENDPTRSNTQSIDLDYDPIRVALHPIEATVFWTNGTGSIFSKNFTSPTETNVPSVKMHWHAHAALTLTISPDGTTLLSGGEEGVIVAWHLMSNERQFLPHLGSNVLRIASNNMGDTYAALLRSNSLVLIFAADLQIVARYDALNAIGDNAITKIGLLNDPRDSSCLVLNGIPGILQSYNPISSKSITERTIDVCGQNIIGKGNQAPILSDVYSVAFSFDGHWMVTYDRRMIAEQQRQHLHHDTLRFWYLNDQGQYEIYDTYDAPHDSPIKQILFCPVLVNGFYQCLTIGEDSRVKVWLNSTKCLTGYEKNGEAISRISWALYENLSFRGIPCASAAYSTDGSLFALAFNQTVNLYNPINLRLVKAITGLGGSGCLKELLFVDDYLIALDDTLLFVWSLGSLELLWTFSINARCLKAHPRGKSFFIIANDLFLTRFQPETPVPLQCWKHENAIQAFDFVSTSRESPPILSLLDSDNTLTLIIMDHNFSLKTITQNEESNKYQTRREQVRAHLSSITSSITNPDEKSPVIVVPAKKRLPILPRFPNMNIDELLLTKVPSHHLPNPIDYFDIFIQARFPISA